MATVEHQNVQPAEEHIIPFYATKKEESKRCTTLKNKKKTEMEKKKTISFEHKWHDGGKRNAKEKIYTLGKKNGTGDIENDEGS